MDTNPRVSHVLFFVDAGFPELVRPRGSLVASTVRSFLAIVFALFFFLSVKYAVLTAPYLATVALALIVLVLHISFLALCAPSLSLRFFLLTRDYCGGVCMSTKLGNGDSKLYIKFQSELLLK